ncbi:PREDICTED: probable purine permease 22 isoform X2 [Tarenaya hassleriana]|uniref:probable purine permease 22 isoform X2 n=1 Tax=Tarenaya hassleriana TaxID=28532 RepID=UPI00053C3439|nr:PREDICTED: probable purine permease 22 isoform X2 [Tarenaya hassleriana]
MNSAISSAEEQEHVRVPESDQPAPEIENQRRSLELKQRKWWISVFFCAFLILVGESLVTLLLNFYYVQDARQESDQDKQYSGTWTQSLIQNAAFPILVPLFLLFPLPKPNPETSSNVNETDHHNLRFRLLLLYFSLGVLVAAHSKLYALGKLYANYGFFSWISATQLIFTSIFTALINRFKFNRWVIISMIITILAYIFGTPEFGGSPDEDEEFYNLQAWCTFSANVAFSLSLCIMQLGFEKVLVKMNKKGFRMVLEMQICVSLIASLICLVGLFASGEFKELKLDFEGFNKGKSYYILSLVGLALSWQVWAVGLTGLVFYVSGLFADVVHMCVSPVLALLVVYAFRFMDDDFGWPRRGALIGAVLAFASYVYFLRKTKKTEIAELNPRENEAEV